MILSVAGLRRSFGHIIAVDEVSFELEPGQIVGLTGPSRAGKTTLLRLLAGALEPEFGSIRLLGFDFLVQRRRGQAQLGYVADGAPLALDATPALLLRRTAQARGLREREARHAVNTAAQGAKLDAAFEQPLASLTLGQRRRLALAAAVVHDPVLLLLDGLDEGLDPQELELLREAIRTLARDRALLFVSRSLSELEALAERVILLYRGRVVGDCAVRGGEPLGPAFAAVMSGRGAAR